MNCLQHYKYEYIVQLHFYVALDSLGFGAYKDEAQAVLQEAKAVATSKRRKKSKLEHLGIPEEELLRQQQELFAQVSNARAKYYANDQSSYILILFSFHFRLVILGRAN